MKNQDIKKMLSDIFPAFLLDRILPKKLRESLFFLSLFSGVFLGIVLFTKISTLFGHALLLNPSISKIYGIFYISSGIFLKITLIKLYYNSLYFSDCNQKIKDGNVLPAGTFLLAEIYYKNDYGLFGKNRNDAISDLIESSFGKELFLRLDILDKIRQFNTDKETAVPYDDIEIKNDGQENNIMHGFLDCLFEKSNEFKEFLFKNGIQKDDLLSTCDWIIWKTNRKKKEERSWSRDNLSSQRGIGSDWAYGNTFFLEKYGGKLEELYDLKDAYLTKDSREKLDEIENVLTKDSRRNVIIVGDDPALNISLLQYLSKDIATGKYGLKNKNIFVLDSQLLIATTKQKSIFETEFFSIMDETIRAGNVILCIRDLPGFIKNCASIGVELSGLLDTYINNSGLQIIALSSKSAFHQAVEKDSILIKSFEKVQLDTEGLNSLLDILFKESEALEENYGVIFSYKSILAIAKDCTRIFSSEILIDKSIDILKELPIYAVKHGKTFITEDLTEQILVEKTSIPIGKISDGEKEKLLNLETEMHKRIVGQDEAITAISNTLKRLRANISDSKRPIGSFLFIGPTGVGKTEMVKTLAEIFFGDKENIIRFDMSEYESDEGLEKLIGSFKTGEDGVLSNRLRDKPYGVLLLDEFEKASKDVVNLFLQILDEGFFSDMSGKMVNMRNTIIIATSNAESDTIWKLGDEKKNISEHKDFIIEEIIKNGIFKPELLNRFDSVILFHRLEGENLKNVTKIMLDNFKKSMRAKGFDIEFEDSILNFLLLKGSDPKFGARPIRRAIQDSIEKVCAEKIIKGELKVGDKFLLKKEDIDLYQN